MTRSANFIAFAACLMFSAIAAAPASASTSRAQTISHADLNLNNSAGAQAMLGRIDHASRVVCGARSGPMTLVERQMTRACITERSTRAVTRLDNPTVTAMYYHREPTIVVASN